MGELDQSVPQVQPAGTASLTLSEAASACGVHRNTIRRRLDQGHFPNAFRDARGWRVPAADLEAAGLSPKKLDAVGEPSVDGDVQSLRREVDGLRQLVVELEKRADLAEAIAAERQRRIDDLRVTLRMLQAGTPARIVQEESAEKAPSETQPEPQPEPLPRPEPQPEPQPEPLPRPEPQPEPLPRPEPQPEPLPQPQAEAAFEVTLDVTPLNDHGLFNAVTLNRTDRRREAECTIRAISRSGSVLDQGIFDLPPLEPGEEFAWHGELDVIEPVERYEASAVLK